MSSEEGDEDEAAEDDDDAPSCSYPHQRPIQDLSYDDFRQLLVDIANWHDRLEYLDMLRVLLRDHVNDNHKLKGAKTVMDLLCCLIGPGTLSPTNLTVLYGIVKVTGQVDFKSSVRAKLPSFRNVEERDDSTFTPHRLQLIELGKTLSQSDVATLDARYNLPLLKKYSDSWSLIMDLESRMEISEGSMAKFNEVLRTNGIGLTMESSLDDDKMGPSVVKRQKLELPNNQDECIRKYLLSRQHSLCCNANRFTPATMNSLYQVDIAHMFTDLDLLKENKRKIDPKPITLDKVLSIIKATPACKVLIDGEGGIGKTTLLRYIAYNWAKGIDETFKGKIVFPVNIRDIEKGEDVLDVIVKQIKLKHFNLKTDLPENPKLIKRFIVNHDDEVVLLLDGLDELGIGIENPITLFKKEELENSTVILTSRSEKIDGFIKESSIHVKVKGFNAENIKKYIKKHFAFFEVPELGESLINELELDEEDEVLRGDKHPEVYSMCKNPMLLLSVCIMWEESKYLPAEKTVLFEEVFRSIINQYNRDNNEQNISSFKDTPKQLINAMLVLGKCMYEGLKINQIYINRKSLKGNKKIVSLALKLGFVYKDKPNSKTNFEDIFTAPHKLIVEALVGFYFYKLSQGTAGFNQKRMLKKKAFTLNPLDESEWKIIRESEHLKVAREFALGFLGADASKFLNHWITDSFTTYRGLMSQLKIVKEEYRVGVENALNGYLSKKGLEIKPYIDEVCTSLKRIFHRINPDINVNVDDHFIKLVRHIHGIGPMCAPLQDWCHADADTLMECVCNEQSSAERGRILAHIMVAVPNQNMFLEKIHETWTEDDDVVRHLNTECQKLKLKYDITSYSLYESPITSSYMVHLLSNAPNLQFLNLDVSITSPVANDMLRECTSRGITLALKKLFIRDSNLSNINGSSLAALLIVAPKLNNICMIKCSLSGVIMDEMIKKCYSKGVPLLLDSIDISDNDLGTICGSSLTSLLIIAPKLQFLDMHNCNLSGNVVDDMARSFSGRVRISLVLEQLYLNGNMFGNISGSSLPYLMTIAPKLKYLDISNCRLSGDMVNVMTNELSKSTVRLALHTLNISDNNLSNVDGFSLGSLISMAPKLTDFYMSSCSLSGVIMNDMSKKCYHIGVKLELESLHIDGSNLSTINGSSLSSLLSVALQPSRLDISKCSLSGSIMNDMARDLCSKQMTLKLDHLNINGNCLGDVDGTSLASLIVAAPDIDMLYMSDCSLSGDIMNDMIGKCISSDVLLKLMYLDVSSNDLSNVDGHSLASLLVITPGLKFLYMNGCSLSGVIINTMIAESTSRGLKTELGTLGISCNNLSNIDYILLIGLMDIAPELDTIDLHDCSLPDDVVNNIKREFSSRGIDLKVDDDDDDDDDDSEGNNDECEINQD